MCPMPLASKIYYMAVADILLEYGAAASALGDDGSALLHQALSEGHADLAKHVLPTLRTSGLSYN